MSIDDNTKHIDVVKSLGPAKWIVENLFVGDELEFAKYLDYETTIDRCITERCAHIWCEQLELDFIELKSRSMLESEQNQMLKNLPPRPDETEKKQDEQLVIEFIEAANFEKHSTSRKKLDIIINRSNDLFDSIRIFKENLLVSNILMRDRIIWCRLIESLVRAKKQGFTLQQTCDILKYARLFEKDDLNQLIDLLLSQRISYVKICQSLFCQLIRKLCANLSESQKQLSKIVGMVEKNVIDDESVSEGGGRRSGFLKLLITHLAVEYNSGMRFEPSEFDTLRNVIEMSIRLGFFHELPGPKLLKRLEQTTSVIKWHTALKLQIIKCELNRREESYDDLAADILSIERLRGIDVTSRFIELVKNVEIDDLLLR